MGNFWKIKAIFPKTALKTSLKIAIWAFFRGLKSKFGYFLGFSKIISDEHTYHFYIKSPPPGPKLLMTSQFPQKSYHRYLLDSRLHNKGEEKKESKLLFFRKLTLLKSKFRLTFFLEPLIQSNLNANFLGSL